MTTVVILAEILLALPAILGAFVLSRTLYRVFKKFAHGKFLFVLLACVLALEVSLVTSIQYLSFWYYLGLNSLLYVGLVAIGANRLYRIAKFIGRELT